MNEVKKSISIILSLIMVLSLFTAVPFTAGAVTTDKASTSASSGNYDYEVLDDGTAEITDYNGSTQTLTIPSGINGYTVTSIGSYTFAYNQNLTSVTIPDSVTSIGWSAFENCTSLKSVTIPDSVTSIGDDAFSYCESLTSITIPDSVTSIGNYAFSGCTSLTSVTIGNGVTWMGSSALYDTGYYNDSSNWETGVLYIDDYLIEADSDTVSGEYKVKVGTKLIANYAFENCKSLTSMTIPDSVTSIGVGAFEECASLKSINVESNNANYCSVDGVLFNKTKTELIKYPISKTGSTYEIPNSVTSIGDDAFSSCTSLTSITIPDSVTSISWGTFEGCTNLTSVTIGNGVTSIGEYAFSDCTSLKSIKIPDSVTSVGDSAFNGCTSLTSITIPDSVTSIGGSAFYNTGYYSDSSNWETGVLYIDNFLIEADSDTVSGEYKVKDGTKAIAGGAFEECTNLTSVTIPNSVTNIGYSAFWGCTSLTKVTIPDSVTSIEYGTFCLCENLTSITIPDSVTIIGDNAFEFCTSLTSVKFGNGVKGIGDSAYFGCESLVSITIPDSVTSIGNSAFGGCESLTSITIPNSVTSIEEYALGYCFDEDTWDSIKMDNFKITGYTGTEAERYAKDNGFKFVSLGDAPITAVFGDVDDDGVVSVMDATEIQRYKAEIISEDMLNLAAADVDTDGKVTILDATRIQRYKAELCNLDGSIPYIQT